MKKYLLAHDLGTSGNKATLYTIQGELIKSKVFSYNTKYFNDNWAEQDPNDWWKAVVNTTQEFLKDISANNIAAVSFSGQMMGCLCVDKNGTPLRNHILWADMRATSEANEIEEKLGMEDFYRITGHRISSSYSLSKFLWIKTHEPDIYKNTYKILNAKDYIIYKLTGEFVTDYSDASGTNILDLNELKWSAKILNEVGIDEDKLPKLLPSTEVAGMVTLEASKETGLLNGTPVVVGGGDGSCAAVGAGCINEGETYIYLGSSSWVSLTKKKPFFDRKMRTFNWAHVIPGYIAPCGTMQSAGGSYTWLKNNICKYESKVAKETGQNVYDIINELAASSPVGANGVFYLPYLMGERSPRWDPYAKGAIIGLKMENTRADVFRAILEGVVMNLGIIFKIFNKDMDIKSISIIGGGGKGNLWRKIIADVFSVVVNKSQHLEEATSIGAAVIAGVGIGVFKNFSYAKQFIKIEDSVQPNKENHKKYNELLNIFNYSYEVLKPLFPMISK